MLLFPEALAQYGGSLGEEGVEEKMQGIGTAGIGIPYVSVAEPVGIGVGAPVHRAGFALEQSHHRIVCYMEVLIGRVGKAFVSFFQPLPVTCGKVVFPGCNGPHHPVRRNGIGAPATRVLKGLGGVLKRLFLKGFAGNLREDPGVGEIDAIHYVSGPGGRP